METEGNGFDSGCLNFRPVLRRCKAVVSTHWVLVFSSEHSGVLSLWFHIFRWLNTFSKIKGTYVYCKKSFKSRELYQEKEINQSSIMELRDNNCHLPEAFFSSLLRRSLVGCSPCGREESDTTERLQFPFSLSCIGEGNGNPLQCSCLENPRDGGPWWAAVYGVAQSQTGLKRLSSSSSTIFSFEVI